ncbi:helix-turn-helix domain-containing protein [Clostridium minihomine]|uniref:helix-turn-helix domain-containing protein n=1 Tax=Clostridium minihomine TaxID=2045012 RepID=UPI000C758D6D
MKIGLAIAIRIVELCIERSISPKELSTQAGLPKHTMTRILYDENFEPRIEELKRLCDHLEITMRDFFDSYLFC